MNEHVFLDLLKPLLTDPCSQIQQCSAITLGRLVHYDPRVAEEILNQQILPILLDIIKNGNVSFKICHICCY